ncbi:hypothetical protein RND81_08G032400 [Saponaria officinalis]|uniref:Peptidase C14 caspase domain-containing protein n=1 Tax=Saponaria officinalis TaxID=3572 RepID=A0AAW1J247_SAPOF
MGKKKAVLIGINYPGTEAELKGCVNDVSRMRTCLIQRYGFNDQDINVLIDTDPSYTEPTGKNIRRALEDLVGFAEAGDELFVHYSGHGFRLPAETGDDDDTGYDECIVPSDMNLITDDDFKELVCQVKDGCRITVVSDSCHSGGLISGAKEQIGDSTTFNRRDHHTITSKSSLSGFLKNSVKVTVRDAFEARGIKIPSRRSRHNKPEDIVVVDEERYQGHRGYVKSKSLALSTLIEILKQRMGRDRVAVGKIRPALYDIFGDDASPKVKKFMKIIFNKLRLRHGGQGLGSSSGSGGILSAVGGLAIDFLKLKLENSGADYAKPAMETKVESTEEVYAGETNRLMPRNGILLSACQTNETAADASPYGNPSEAFGVFSNAIQSILNEFDGEVTNLEIVVNARLLLEYQGFTQSPGLYCSDDYVNVPFVY